VINTALMARRRSHSHREASLEDWLSNDERQAPLEIADPRPDPEQVCSSSEIASSVNEQFNLLPPALRSVFQLRHIEGLSCLEAGPSLGISLSAMKSRLVMESFTFKYDLNHRCLSSICFAKFQLRHVRQCDGQWLLTGALFNR